MHMKILLAVLMLSLSLTTTAETLWSDFSITLLRGSDYEVGDNKRTVATFEHAAGHSWGDSFSFVDRLQSDDGSKVTYGEFSPRLELSKYQNAFMKNIYLASTIEFGNNFTHYLLGVGTNIKVPHFKFVKVNFYQRNNDSTDNSQQMTLAWSLPVANITYDGFIDYVSASDDKHTSMNMTSQLKYNIGPALSIKTKLFIGIEYVFWNNKFGINGIDERNVNLLLKYHF